MNSNYRILAQEVYTPPVPARRRPDPTQPSARTEATLLGGPDLAWTVAWKTSAMSGPAFIPFTRLPDAWAAYQRHREYVRQVKEPPARPNRRAELERQIGRLQSELEALP